MSSTGNPPVCLTVAATDSGGAAGTAADLATFAALGVHGACVITAVTAQDTTGVRDVHVVPTRSVGLQLDAVLEDLPVATVKTGMLGSPATVELLTRRLAGTGLAVVVDPVLVATSGAVLGDEAVARAYLEHLLPAATVVTPNADEARTLTGLDAAPRELAVALTQACPAVVLTGGGTTGTCTDWVAVRGHDPVPLTHPAVATENDHGTGCTYSAALAALLAHARGAAPTGAEPPDPEHLVAAARRAGAYTTRQLEHSRAWTLGRGRGPIAHVPADPTAGDPHADPLTHPVTDPSDHPTDPQRALRGAS